MVVKKYKCLYSDRIYIKIKPSSIAYLKFIIEGYDNLAYVSIVDKQEAIVKITFTSEYKMDIKKIIKDLEKEMDIKWIPL